MIIFFGSISTNLTDFGPSGRSVNIHRNVTFNSVQLHALYTIVNLLCTQVAIKLYRLLSVCDKQITNCNYIQQLPMF